MIEVLEYSIDNVKTFHQEQMPKKMWMQEMKKGIFVGEKVVPLEAVACYVPRGKGSFPSVVMMTTIPAITAGVARPIIITPPDSEGGVDTATLVAAQIIGIKEVYKCGGAVGVSAVAYGTKSVPKCQKIIGPGSPFVLAAKKLLSDYLDPSLEAGPSESIVLADESANGQLSALDLLIEAEHGKDSSAYLVTHSEEVAQKALETIPNLYKEMGQERASYASFVLSNSGGIILTDTKQEAIDFVNAYAPEHLQIHSKTPHDYLSSIHNAGEILLGEHTPFCIGNYALGPNAVLPTNFAAHTKSALSVYDCLKTISIGYVTQKGYEEIAPLVYDFRTI